jgi:hypothetical protein
MPTPAPAIPATAPAIFRLISAAVGGAPNAVAAAMPAGVQNAEHLPGRARPGGDLPVEFGVVGAGEVGVHDRVDAGHAPFEGLPGDVLLPADGGDRDGEVRPHLVGVLQPEFSVACDATAAPVVPRGMISDMPCSGSGRLVTVFATARPVRMIAAARSTRYCGTTSPPNDPVDTARVVAGRSGGPGLDLDFLRVPLQPAQGGDVAEQLRPERVDEERRLAAAVPFGGVGALLVGDVRAALPRPVPSPRSARSAAALACRVCSSSASRSAVCCWSRSASIADDRVPRGAERSPRRRPAPARRPCGADRGAGVGDSACSCVARCASSSRIRARICSGFTGVTSWWEGKGGRRPSGVRPARARGAGRSTAQRWHPGGGKIRPGSCSVVNAPGERVRRGELGE